MADFEIAFEKLLGLEFSNKENALHHNEGEDGYTFMGIYQKYYSNNIIWRNLKAYQKIAKDQKQLSELMYNNIENQNQVRKIYKENYWDKARLDDIESQKIANNIFVFGVNAGLKTAVKIAQRLVKTKTDGIVGNKTIKALDCVDEDYFVKEYKERIKNYYINLAINNSKYKKYLEGWLNRVELT